MPLVLHGVDLPNETIRSARLVLRPHRPADAAAVQAACQDPQILRFITLMPDPYTRPTPGRSSR